MINDNGEENFRTINCPVCDALFWYDREVDEPHCGKPFCSGKYQEFLDAEQEVLLK